MCCLFLFCSIVVGVIPFIILGNMVRRAHRERKGGERENETVLMGFQNLDIGQRY